MELRSKRHRAGALLVLVALAVASAGAARGEETEPDGSAVELPVSFGKVWYRPAIKSGFGSGKQSGYLSVTVDGMEFTSKKDSDFVPWSAIEMVSYGRMQGDPDTRWVVLGLAPVGGQRRQAGFRDGSRMGYGTATEAIFEAVVEGLRQAGRGPYEVEEGRTPYITRFLQFTVSVPDGWSALEVSNTLSDGRPLWGRTLFSPLGLKAIRSDVERLDRAMHAIERGVEPAVQLDRVESGDGFDCDQLKKAGRAVLRDELVAGLRPWKLVREPEWSAQPHRGCTAWVATATVEKSGTSVELRMFAVSDGQTAYLLSTRDDAVEPREFDAWTRSLRTPVAR